MQARVEVPQGVAVSDRVLRVRDRVLPGAHTDKPHSVTMRTGATPRGTDALNPWPCV